MLVASPDAGTDSIGQRIIEMPENQERAELRDDASGFLAYEPMGSVMTGEVLVKSGGSGKTTPCAICHGFELKGLGPVPALAGRSPSYIVGQPYDMRHGLRYGPCAELMKRPARFFQTDNF